MTPKPSPLERDLRTPEGLFSYLRPCFSQSGYQSIHVLCLDDQDRLLHHAWFPKIDNHDDVYFRVLSVVFFVKGTAKLILGHGHSRRSASPNVGERRLRVDVARALANLGVELRDHVVLSWTGNWSFREGCTQPIGQGADVT